MKYIAISLLGYLLAFSPIVTQGAKAPVSPEGLKKEASHIVIGQVVKVTSKTQKSENERAWGIHRDRVFMITLKVSKVMKGIDIQTGDQITIIAWQPSLRLPPLAGLQGHDHIPEKDDTVTVYLKGKEGNAFRPILPNGIVIQKKTD